MVTAGYMSGKEFTPPAWDDTRADFDAWLARTPDPARVVTKRDQINDAFRRALGIEAA